MTPQSKTEHLPLKISNADYHSKRLRVGVVFGGRSVEHEVSLVSAASVLNALDPKLYEIIPIGIAADGHWLSSGDALKLLKEKTSLERIPEQILVPDPRKRALVGMNGATGIETKLDVIFPVVHGTYAEDGTLQGLLELADVPYVGAGVLGSAVGMDKIVQKQLLLQAKIPVAPMVWFLFDEYKQQQNKLIATMEKSLKYPMFVKPAHSGSSIGISKAHNRKELEEAIGMASQYDWKILVERAVPDAREIECAVLGNDAPEASVLGEIIPSNEFYDYDAKYVDGKSNAVIPAKLPAATAKKIRALALEAFRTLDCSGMARVDFLVSKKTNKFYLNEINTLPGFTSISMYPKLWEATGLAYPKLLDKLIQLALERHAQKSKLQTTYQPKNNWYR
jgi:D-alanine-D-alanine ligase